ncbi:hypothetical protein FRX31_028625 [Thalictrum thalictroides]|uniref:DUF4283 domain-containing protein n=1 Tax=Thalictrum thalictroides TaxID=46969 RepID=A0A7J6VAS1_THATH|nr:hypothetical protein FRX31_028625 [Thalictrum thalictroides]
MWNPECGGIKNCIGERWGLSLVGFPLHLKTEDCVRSMAGVLGEVLLVDLESVAMEKSKVKIQILRKNIFNLPRSVFLVENVPVEVVSEASLVIVQEKEDVGSYGHIGQCQNLSRTDETCEGDVAVVESVVAVPVYETQSTRSLIDICSDHVEIGEVIRLRKNSKVNKAKSWSCSLAHHKAKAWFSAKREKNRRSRKRKIMRSNDLVHFNINGCFDLDVETSDVSVTLKVGSGNRKDIGSLHFNQRVSIDWQELGM